jgi:hypothetical protein
LCQHKVAQGQRLFQCDAALFNLVFCAIELGCYRSPPSERQCGLLLALQPCNGSTIIGRALVPI